MARQTIFDAQQSVVVSTLKCTDPALTPQFAGAPVLEGGGLSG
jgi:hypothetical protein